jgi:hypothetical protein
VSGLIELAEQHEREILESQSAEKLKMLKEILRDLIHSYRPKD